MDSLYYLPPAIKHGGSEFLPSTADCCFEALEYDGAVGTATEAVELCRRTGNKLRRTGTALGVIGLLGGILPSFTGQIHEKYSGKHKKKRVEVIFGALLLEGVRS